MGASAVYLKKRFDEKLDREGCVLLQYASDDAKVCHRRLSLTYEE